MGKRIQIFVSYGEEGHRWAEWVAEQCPDEICEIFLQQRNLKNHLGSLKDLRDALDHFDRVIIIASPNYADSIALCEWPQISAAASLAVVKICATDEMMSLSSLNVKAAELSKDVLSARLREWLLNASFSSDKSAQLIRSTPEVFPPIWRVPFACRVAAVEEFHSAAHLRANLDEQRRVVLPAATDTSLLDLAIHYAYQYRGQYKTVVFVNCQNEIQICTDLSALTGLLDLSQTRYFDQPVLVAAVKRWFELNDAWLLVFYNVPDCLDLRRYEPAGHSGHIIVVSATGIDFGRPIPEMGPPVVKAQKQPSVDIGKGLETDIMNLMSWLGPEILPYHVWETDTEFSQKSGALLSLARAGYIELTRDGTRLAPAVQHLLQVRQSATERQHNIEQALSLLIRNLPPGAQDYRKWPRYAALATHILYATGQATTHHAGSDSSVRLLNQLAIYQFRRFHFERATALMRSALATAVEAYGPEHELVSLCYNNLGVTLNELGEHGSALDCFSKALAVDTTLYGSNSARIATRLTNISQTLFTLGRTEEAIHFARRAIKSESAGENTKNTRVPARLLNLAQLLEEVGDLEEATSLAQRAVDAAKAIYGSAHPQVAYYSTKLAGLMELQNRLRDAECLLTRALAINTAYYGSAHWKYYASVEALNRCRAIYKSTHDH